MSNENSKLDAELDQMRRKGMSIDGDNAYKRDLLDCVVGALAFGKQRSAPPPAGHWLERFYEIGKAEADERDALRASLPVGVPVCDTCHGQGEICIGEQTFGYMSMQPPEPIMDVCPECGGDPAPSLPAAGSAAEERCATCDGTGDVHRADGEWLGECHCSKAEITESDEHAALHQLAFELGGTDDGEYLLDADDLDKLIVAALSARQSADCAEAAVVGYEVRGELFKDRSEAIENSAFHSNHRDVFALVRQSATTVADYEEYLADQRRLVRELDVLLNGEDGAAPQASLCDIVGQVSSIVRDEGLPLLAAFSARKSAPERVGVPVEWREAVKELFDAKQAKDDFERENPGNSTKRWDACLYRIEAAEDALRALLASHGRGEA